jgi:prefoldin subunit 5
LNPDVKEGLLAISSIDEAITSIQTQVAILQNSRRMIQKNLLNLNKENDENWTTQDPKEDLQ